MYFQPLKSQGLQETFPSVRVRVQLMIYVSLPSVNAGLVLRPVRGKGYLQEVPYHP